MKIAIYHNLNKGGALEHLSKFVKYAQKNNLIDIYSPNNQIEIKTNGKNYNFKTKRTKNIFDHLIQIIFELPVIDKKIFDSIKKNKYDLILVFPCHLIQSPYIIKYLKDLNVTSFYIFEESKREFYENTSFDHYSVKSFLSRTIRIPTKIIDKHNCRQARTILVNSNYSKKILQKIYQKKGIVVYLGLKKIKPKKIVIRNNRKILSIGILTKLKGYEFTLKQIHRLVNEITIIGHKTYESDRIIEMAKKLKIKINLIETFDQKKKNKIIKEHSIFIANYINEPFGISTLEAANQNRIILGFNEAGTKEIIDNKKNGYLYSRNISEARTVLSKILKKDKITLWKTSALDWKYTTEQILSLYHKFKNTPNE